MIAQQGALHDDRKMQRRTKSAPALGADANRGRSPVTRLRSTAALNKEESLARSSRLIFDTVAERDKLDALGQQTSRAGDGAGTTGRKKKKKKDTGASPATNSLSSSFSSYASTAPDPAQSCGAWLRHWSEDGAVAWATEYFARRR
ncbi:hypothetical protein DIPPA_32939 [Diplonema papillatum]|nr:hypothetical protein DIPPA_32939 [Diplonema papillatum]